jgi:hypothetical protein
VDAHNGDLDDQNGALEAGGSKDHWLQIPNTFAEELDQFRIRNEVKSWFRIQSSIEVKIWIQIRVKVLRIRSSALESNIGTLH